MNNMKITAEQSDTKTKRIKGWKWTLIILSSFLLVILIGYFLLSVISSTRLVNFFNTKLTKVEVLDNNFDHANYSSQADFYYQKAFLSSQLSLLESDSLNLIVDLKDSSVYLVIDGVTIHSAKVSRYSLSNFFKILAADAYTQIFSRPFTVESYDATIVKEPITIKEAPKDTVEAANFFEMPDTLINEFVAVSMALDYNFILTFQQEEKPHSSEWKEDRFFFLKKRVMKVKRDIQQMGRLIIPQAEPEIRVALPKDDLVTIYRALPISTRISVRLR